MKKQNQFLTLLFLLAAWPGASALKAASPGTVVAWGNNDSGQTTVPLAAQSGVMAIAAGSQHTVALKTNGSVVAWGQNSLATVPTAASNGVAAIAAGGSHTVALKTNGAVLAWGDNSQGQTTVPVGLSGVTAVAAGYNYTVALKNDGSVVAWGINGLGLSTVPIAAQSGVRAISAGGQHIVALKNDGSVIAWGANSLGQATVPIAAQSGVTAVAAGYEHTVALKNDGSVVAWGNNSAGQTTVPVAALSGVAAIAAGAYYTVALKNDGSVVAWGVNGSGQTTVPVAALGGVTAITAGSAHTAALIGGPYPLIVSQPVHQAVFAGSNATFTVSATTDNPPLRYQWRFNGTDLSEATNDSLTITNVQAADAGAYQVLVSVTGWSVGSFPAILSLRDAPAPTVTTLAAADIASVTAVLRGTVNPNGAAATAYFEYGLSTAYGNRTPLVNLPAGGSVVVISNLLTGLALSTTYHYRLVAGNSGGTNQGDDMSFTTLGLPVAGHALSFDGLDDHVSINPTGAVRAPFTVELWANTRDIVGERGLLGSRAPSEYGFDFKLRNGNQIHGDIGNGSNWITITADAPFTYASNTWYHFAYVVTATNYTIYANGDQVGAGTYPTAAPVLFDTQHQLFIGSIRSYQEFWQGQIDEVRAWSVARSEAEIQQTMNVPLSGFDPGLAAYWRFDEDTGTIAADSSGQGRTGTLVNGVTWAVSTVSLLPVPSIVSQPANQLVLAGANATFSVSATTDNPPLRYQWRFNGTIIVGATNDSLTISNVQSPDVGGYTVLVSDTVGSVSSASATLGLLAPYITMQPVDVAVKVSSSATFSVLAGGAPPLRYQWRLNGANIATGTNASLLVTNVQAAQLGDYAVVITNSFGSVTSTLATLAFPTPPTIVQPPLGQTNIAGDNVTFAVTITNNATLPVTYQWRKESVVLTNIVLNSRTCSFTLFNVAINVTTTNGPGRYRVVVTNAASTGLASPLVTLSVLPATAPTATTLAASNVIAVSATLNASVNPMGAQTVAWFDYGLTAAYGSRTEVLPVGNASSLVVFQQAVSSLLSGTNYHYRVVATNHGGMALGADLFFQTTTSVAPPVISAYDLLGTGQFRLRFDSTPGSSFSVLVSTNLTDWNPLGPAVELTPGHFEFTDIEAPGHPTRFYRLRTP